VQHGSAKDWGWAEASLTAINSHPDSIKSINLRQRAQTAGAIHVPKDNAGRNNRNIELYEGGSGSPERNGGIYSSKELDLYDLSSNEVAIDSYGSADRSGDPEICGDVGTEAINEDIGLGEIVKSFDSSNFDSKGGAEDIVDDSVKDGDFLRQGLGSRVEPRKRKNGFNLHVRRQLKAREGLGPPPPNHAHRPAVI